MRVHLAQVTSASGARRDTVLDRLGEHLKRGQRRAQVVRQGDYQSSPRVLRRRAASLLLDETRDHRVGGTREVGQLVVSARAEVGAAVSQAHGAQAGTQALDV